jgi:hypothetical protein
MHGHMNVKQTVNLEYHIKKISTMPFIFSRVCTKQNYLSYIVYLQYADMKTL